MKSHKNHFLPVLLLLAGSFLAFTIPPIDLQTILLKLKTFHDQKPQEKIYVHFDKPFYAPGDSVWYKAYLVDATLHKPDSQSNTVYLEVIDTSKSILQRQVLYAPNGTTFGDLKLSDTLRPGKYMLRAYTNYMKNLSEDFFFLKELEVVGRDMKTVKTDDYVLDSIDLQFFPEGGNLLATIENVIAFKAVGPDGKSFPASGEIRDETNAVVASFKSAHDGMGSFKMIPIAGKKYKAVVTAPYQLNRNFNFPTPVEKGYGLRVSFTPTKFNITVLCNDASPTNPKTISVLIQSRGQAYVAKQGRILSTTFTTTAAKSVLPDGISQITIFDSEGRPVAERLIYVHHPDETIAINTTLDKTSYAKRELVTVNVESLYRNGSAASGNFSVSVYDEQLLPSPEKYPMTITNYLSLTSDLKGFIENPGYYFKDTLDVTKSHLDLLMMVHGWRRFTWNDILTETALKFNHEKGLPLSGMVQKPASGNPVEAGTIKIMDLTGKVIIVKPDSVGRFYTDSFLFYDTMKLVFQTENEKGKKKPYKFLLDPFNPSPPTKRQITPSSSFDPSDYLKQQQAHQAIDAAKMTTTTRQLQEVEISASRIAKSERDTRLVSMGSKVIEPKNTGTAYANIFQFLSSNPVAGMIVSGEQIKIRGYEPVYMINKSVISPEAFAMISPAHVEKIEVIVGSAASVYGGMGVVHAILKAGAWDKIPVGINTVNQSGYYFAREFYSPRYDVPNPRHNLPDKRSTLYWSPVLNTSAAGQATFSFFTGDATSRYRIVIEGITNEGYAGTSTTTFEVK